MSNVFENARLLVRETRDPIESNRWITRLPMKEVWEDTEQYLHLMRDGSIELELRDWSEKAWEMHRCAIAYFLTVPFASLTLLARSLGEIGEDQRVEIADENKLLGMVEHFSHLFELKHHLEEHDIPFSMAFQSYLPPRDDEEAA